MLALYWETPLPPLQGCEPHPAFDKACRQYLRPTVLTETKLKFESMGLLGPAGSSSRSNSSFHLILSQILVTFFPLRPLGFCKYEGVSNCVLGIGFAIMQGFLNRRLTLFAASGDGEADASD